MSNSARKVIPIHSNDESTTRTGVVISADTEAMSVDLSGKIIQAKKMFSCLVDPEPGDIVLCTQNENGLVYILGIIERPVSKKMNVTFPCDTQIMTRQGNLNIVSPKAVTIASNQVSCFSQQAIHKSRNAVISYDNITASGTELQASFKTVRLISHLINTMASQVIDKFKGYVRCTKENDMVKAGQLTRSAERLYAVDSKHTMMKSRKTTIIDGEKILMG